MVLRENDFAIFCRKTDNKLTTRIGGEGVAELSPLDPIIDSCPDKNFHNCDFGRKFEKTQGLDDALRRWLGGGMKAWFFVLIVALNIAGCGKNVVEWSKVQYRNGIAFLPNEKIPFTGLAEEWFDNAQKRSERNYKIGRKDGLCIDWYENGQKRGEENYKQGQKNGISIRWYDNGQKSDEGKYKDGKMEGLWTAWYTNGQKKGESNWKEGNENGLATVWYDNGQKMGEGNYKNDKVDGPFTEWHENGQKKKVGSYKDGKETGIWIIFKEDGTELIRFTHDGDVRVFD